MRAALSVALMTLVLMFGLFNHFSVQSVTGNMEQSVRSVAEAVSDKRWDDAEAHMREALRLWGRWSKFFLLVTRHDIFEPVYVGMQSLPDLLRSRDESSCMTAALTLREQLALLREAEDFRWENIF